MSEANKNKDEKIRKVLYGLLEKIIFNKNDFADLKRAINNIIIGKIEAKDLRRKIIHSRIKILEELLDLFPFYLDQISKNHSIKDFVENEQNTSLIKELKEKNEFLEKIGQRIENVFVKLKEKQEG